MRALLLMPRMLSILILLVTLSMLVPLTFAVIALVHGAHLPMQSWLFPLCIIAAGAVLISFLSRRQIPLQVYIFAFALWLITAAYYWSRIIL